jgi:cyclohexanone monooxygenase
MDLDSVIVGAGFSGLYMLHRLRGLGHAAVVLEAGDGIGGTWYWNRYPGARCDVESLEYSYSFSEDLQQEWHWPDRYSLQPDILRYVNHMADRFDLRRDVRLATRVVRATFDEAAGRWTIETDTGSVITATYLIMATGCLSVPRVPDLKGLESFGGRWYHTGGWPHEGVDFSGRRVGIIGTGSSGIQAIPIIARQAKHLTVFQRTPNFSVPAWNGPLDPDVEAEFKAHYGANREIARRSGGGTTLEACAIPAHAMAPEAARRELERRWSQGGFNMELVFVDELTDPDANATVAEFAREQIRARVKDPAVAALLCPTDHPFATKRLCVDTDYFETYNRDNVTLVDIRAEPIERATPTGIRTAAREVVLDDIVFATGFDAMTGALMAVDIRGRAGRSLRAAWAEGPRSYLGLMVAGFPNLFTVTGPGSPSVLSNMMTSIEQHVEWIAGCLGHLRDRQLRLIEPSAEAEQCWTDHAREVGDQTLYPRANSWYMGANIPGKPRMFMPYVGGVGAYRKICEDVAEQGYQGFALAS